MYRPGPGLGTVTILSPAIIIMKHGLGLSAAQTLSFCQCVVLLDTCIYT